MVYIWLVVVVVLLQDLFHLRTERQVPQGRPPVQKRPQKRRGTIHVAPGVRLQVEAIDVVLNLLASVPRTPGLGDVLHAKLVVVLQFDELLEPIALVGVIRRDATRDFTGFHRVMDLLRVDLRLNQRIRIVGIAVGDGITLHGRGIA